MMMNHFLQRSKKVQPKYIISEMESSQLGINPSMIPLTPVVGKIPDLTMGLGVDQSVRVPVFPHLFS